MIVSLIAAMAENRVIGNQGEIPWRAPGEQRIFKKRTLGKGVVVGRNTYDSIGRPLRGRTMIVLTRDRSFKAPGCIVVHDLDSAIARGAEVHDEVMIAGGSQIYAIALPRADRVYLTVVHLSAKGDAYFPKLSTEDFRRVDAERHDGPVPFTVYTYHRASS